MTIDSVDPLLLYLNTISCPQKCEIAAQDNQMHQQNHDHREVMFTFPFEKIEKNFVTKKLALKLSTIGTKIQSFKEFCLSSVGQC